MGVFDKIKAGWTDAERAEYERYVDGIRRHGRQRPCPSGCGCTEFYDDRNPDFPEGAFGLAGCACPRCNQNHDWTVDG